ncbi:MAG: CaiB/BaiF CoA-transferase family protein, partial [Devosia sp.]
PGVIERLGLGYAAAKAINPGIVYASITGYGDEGPWADRPGQDLLAQARSGVMWLNGDEGQGPVPFGLAIADMLAGAAVAQGVLAAMIRKLRTGVGSLIETSLLEVLVDFQFEVLTTHLNDGRRVPKRSEFRSAHAYLSAPYGVYPTADGYLAIAMTPIGKLADLLDLTALSPYRDNPASWFSHRDAVKSIIATQLATAPTSYWLSILEPADIWCARVLDWPELMQSEGFKALDMLQSVTREDNVEILTTRSPLRINGKRAASSRAAPLIGEQSTAIRKEFGL